MFWLPVYYVSSSVCLLYTDNKEIGLQFFRNSRGFFPLGKQFIIQVLSERDNSPISKALFSARRIKCFSLSQKSLKNSDGNPSMPGHLSFFICFRAVFSSDKVSLPSSKFDSSGVNLLTFFP